MNNYNGINNLKINIIKLKYYIKNNFNWIKKITKLIIYYIKNLFLSLIISINLKLNLFYS
jgi:hypothetical protein